MVTRDNSNLSATPRVVSFAVSVFFCQGQQSSPRATPKMLLRSIFTGVAMVTRDNSNLSATPRVFPHQQKAPAILE